MATEACLAGRMVTGACLAGNSEYVTCQRPYVLMRQRRTKADVRGQPLPSTHMHRCLHICLCTHSCPPPPRYNFPIHSDYSKVVQLSERLGEGRLGLPHGKRREGRKREERKVDLSWVQASRNAICSCNITCLKNRFWRTEHC